MLSATVIAAICCCLLCNPSRCSAEQQQLCDVTRWVSDNGFPINRLEVSGNSKAKLLQSLQSDAKLIRCSELRLIHKESELDRPFRQSRYKVKANRDERRHRDDRGDDSYSRSDRGDEHSEYQRRRSQSKDDEEGAPSFDKPRERRREFNRGSEDKPQDFLGDLAKEDLEGIFTSSTGENLIPETSTTENPVSPAEEKSSPAADKIEISTENIVSTMSHEDKKPEISTSTAADEKIVKSATAAPTVDEIEVRAANPETSIENRTSADQHGNATLVNVAASAVATENRVSTTNQTATEPRTNESMTGEQMPEREQPATTTDSSALGESTADNFTLTSASDDRVSSTGDNKEFKSNTSASAVVNGTFTKDTNSSNLPVPADGNEMPSVEGIAQQQNDTLRLAARGQPISWRQACSTSPASKNVAHTLRFCRLFHLLEASSPSRKVSRRDFSLSDRCLTCSTTQSRDISIHACRVFFGERNFKPYLSNGSYDTSKAERAASTSVSQTSSLLSCFQCPVIRNGTAKHWHNRTRSVCVFATASYASLISKRHQQLLADKLQFIDEAAVKVESAATSSPAVTGDLEVPTRARHETTRLRDPGNHRQDAKEQPERQNETLDEPSASRHSQPNETTKSDIHAVHHHSAKSDSAQHQLEILSHSVFMEKLFDALLSKRMKTAESNKSASAALVQKVSSLGSKLDQLINSTSFKSDQNDLDDVKLNLYNLTIKLTKALNQMQQQNRRLANELKRLEVMTSAKLSACQNQLNKTSFDLEAISLRQRSQAVDLTRRLMQLSKRMRRTESRCNRTSLQQPAVPSLLQPIDPGSSESRHQIHHTQLTSPPNVYSNPPIQDCSDVYAGNSDRGMVDTDEVITTNVGLAKPVRLRCDVRGGWTYILSRSDGKTDFFRNWTSYRTGFGEPTGEHFIGLDALSVMSARRRYQLRVVLEDWDGSVANVTYGQFQVLGERHNFQLRVDHFVGDEIVGDSLSSHSNASFSTFDFDNDFVQSKFGGNCAKRFRGGFWYFSCYRANPTGQYYPGGKIPGNRCDGIVWKTWKGPHYSLRSIHLKIRPVAH